MLCIIFLYHAKTVYMAETSINLEVISFRAFVLAFIYKRVDSLDSRIRVGCKENKS